MHRKTHLYLVSILSAVTMITGGIQGSIISGSTAALLSAELPYEEAALEDGILNPLSHFGNGPQISVLLSPLSTSVNQTHINLQRKLLASSEQNKLQF